MSGIVFTLFWHNNHDIDVDFHGPSDVVSKHFIHEPLIGWAYIFQSEGHGDVVVIPLAVMKVIFSRSYGRMSIWL